MHLSIAMSDTNIHLGQQNSQFTYSNYDTLDIFVWEKFKSFLFVVVDCQKDTATFIMSSILKSSLQAEKLFFHFIDTY